MFSRKMSAHGKNLALRALWSRWSPAYFAACTVSCRMFSSCYLSNPNVECCSSQNYASIFGLSSVVRYTHEMNFQTKPPFVPQVKTRRHCQSLLECINTLCRVQVTSLVQCFFVVVIVFCFFKPLSSAWLEAKCVLRCLNNTSGLGWPKCWLL